MWTILFAGAAGYYLYKKYGGHAPPPEGLKVVDGALYFDAQSKVSILATLPMLSIRETAHSGGTTYELIPLDAAARNAGAEVTAAVTGGQVVAASTSLLSTQVQTQFLFIGPPEARNLVAGEGSNMALLFDPSHPAE